MPAMASSCPTGGSEGLVERSGLENEIAAADALVDPHRLRHAKLAVHYHGTRHIRSPSIGFVFSKPSPKNRMWLPSGALVRPPGRPLDTR